MNVLLVVYLLILLLSIKHIKYGEFNDSYLSVENTTLLRGILAMSIVLHHMSEKLPDSYFGQLQHLGYMIVAVFFFLSGYGLMLQYTKKGKDYLKGFWTKRILYLLIVYLLVSVLYIIFRAYIICDRPIDMLLHQFVCFVPVAVNSWYISVQLLFYIFFWGAFKIFRSSKFAISSVFILTTILNIIFIAIGLPSIWFISNYAFVLGLIWLYKEKLIIKCVKSHYFLWLCISLAIFTICSALPCVLERISIVGSGTLSDIVTWTSRMVSSCAITIVLIVAMMKFRFVGTPWRILGKMSLDIYLLHAIAYMTLRSQIIYIENPVLWTLGSLAFAFVISYYGNKVSTSIHKYLKKF